MTFREWFFHDARWYEFWFPQSGVVGGLIFGFVLLGAVIFIGEIFLW